MLFYARPRGLPEAPFSLGPRLGVVCNVLGASYNFFISFFLFFPNYVPVSGLNMSEYRNTSVAARVQGPNSAFPLVCSQTMRQRVSRSLACILVEVLTISCSLRARQRDSLGLLVRWRAEDCSSSRSGVEVERTKGEGLAIGGLVVVLSVVHVLFCFSAFKISTSEKACVCVRSCGEPVAVAKIRYRRYETAKKGLQKTSAPSVHLTISSSTSAALKP